MRFFIWQVTSSFSCNFANKCHYHRHYHAFMKQNIRKHKLNRTPKTIGTVENEATVGAYSRIKSDDIQLYYWPSKIRPIGAQPNSGFGLDIVTHKQRWSWIGSIHRLDWVRNFPFFGGSNEEWRMMSKHLLQISAGMSECATFCCIIQGTAKHSSTVIANYNQERLNMPKIHSKVLTCRTHIKQNCAILLSM